MARSNKIRSNKGTGLAELALGMISVIIIAFFALDIGTAMVSYGVNDRACRDAVRAAAQGQNATEATKLAKQIVKTYETGSGLISKPEVLSVNYNDFAGSPPDGVSPFVTVTTRVTARAVAPLNVFGKPMAGGTFPLTKTYTFPIVKLTVNS